MSLNVTKFAASDAEWDEFVAAHEGGTAFHRVAWKRHIESVFGHECLWLCARESNGKLAGVLPLVRVKSRLFGHFLVSVPFASYGGPLGDDDAVRALTEEAVREARESRAGLLELRSRHALPIDLPVSHRKITVVLPLVSGGPDAVMKGFSSKLRSQIRRPAKAGVEVRIGPDQVEPFHRVFASHMRDLGTPTLPLSWFASLRDRFGEDVWFACAYLAGEPIACGAGFRWGDEFEITWASALRAHAATSANMGVYWALIEQASRLGLTRFNYGRCTPGSNTHRFKLQWGALDEPLHWYQWSRGGLDATPNPDSRKFEIATRIWSRLPLALTNTLGPALVRYIP